jgi:NAD-dependent dihydropyrimidine dehydrogenase PreA subunit
VHYQTCLFPDNGGDKSNKNYYLYLKERYENKNNGGKTMKFKVNDKKCGANEKACTILNICPVDAISYTEVDEPITDKDVQCNISSGCGCKCDCGDTAVSCEPNPYGRIIIDYDKCTECGICVEKCCGNAIEAVN